MPYSALTVPTTCPGVPQKILDPKNTWADGNGYDQTARDLAARFRNNFGKYAANVEPEILKAQPREGG
ncbi:MAG: hypothetical protein Q8M54_00205 [Desulfobaccales bacterium]|nr:hypothetical protein [Desulfobaccales bacterium]